MRFSVFHDLLMDILAASEALRHERLLVAAVDVQRRGSVAVTGVDARDFESLLCVNAIWEGILDILKG
jgi:hypothetical protein